MTIDDLFKILKCPFDIQEGAGFLTIKTPSHYVGYVKGISNRYLPLGLLVEVIKDDSVRGKKILLINEVYF